MLKTPLCIRGTAWGTCQDVGGDHAGVVSATMNTDGQVGAVICPVLVVYLKDHSSYGWNADLVLMGASFLVASLFWFLIDPQKKV